MRVCSSSNAKCCVYTLFVSSQVHAPFRTGWGLACFAGAAYYLFSLPLGVLIMDDALAAVNNVGNVANATTNTTAAFAAAANSTAAGAALPLLPALSPFFFVGFFLDVLFALDFIFRMQVNRL